MTGLIQVRIYLYYRMHFREGRGLISNSENHKSASDLREKTWSFLLFQFSVRCIFPLLFLARQPPEILFCCHQLNGVGVGGAVNEEKGERKKKEGRREELTTRGGGGELFCKGRRRDDDNDGCGLHHCPPLTRANLVTFLSSPCLKFWVEEFSKFYTHCSLSLSFEARDRLLSMNMDSFMRRIVAVRGVVVVVRC